MSSFTFEKHGFTIDLEVPYATMFEYSVIGADGQRAFHCNAKDVRAAKRLLHDLFGVPVADKMHPVNHAVRIEARNRLKALGWAVEDEGRSARYSLHREL